MQEMRFKIAVPGTQSNNFTMTTELFIAFAFANGDIFGHL